MGKKRCGGDDEEDLSLLHHKDECLIQILLWLPVVFLLRCKCVCKSWRDLIQSPLFIRLHTTATSTLNSSASCSSKFGSFILQVAFDRFYPTPTCNYLSEHAFLMLSSSDSDSESVSISGAPGGGCNDDQEEEEEELVVLKLDNLGFPSTYKFNIYSKEIVGSCNGLVCLHDREISSYSGGSEPDEVSLWNPATGQFRILPKSITIDGDCPLHNLVVFGFDVKTKDYKVVQFTGLKPRWNGNGPANCFCRVQVYSLSTDSWRLLEGIPCLPGYPFQYTDSIVYLNGTCFFLAHFFYFYTKHRPCLPQNDRFIISFDFTKEIITPIQLPDHNRDQELCLHYMGDKIALLTSPKVFGYDTQIRTYEEFNIWVLNYEHGSCSSINKESWTKLHSFRIQLESPDEWYIPRGISNDGKFALLESDFGKKMNLYNLVTEEVEIDFLSCEQVMSNNVDTNEVKMDFLSGGQVMSKAHAYKPSLVSIIGGNGAGSSRISQ